MKNKKGTKENEFNKVSKLNLDATEKQDKLDAYADEYEKLLKIKH